MFLLSKPPASFIETFLRGLSRLEYSYAEVGTTRSGTHPRYFNSDSAEGVVGSGQRDFEQAKTALSAFHMFPAPWTEVFREGHAIAAGQNVAVLIRHLGFWSLNPARIIYLIDEPARFGFAYGTLSGHAERGEELFVCAIDSDTGDVRYKITAFSRPASPLAMLGYPIARFFQERFRQESVAAVNRFVSAGR